jgi:hypothetical protein
MTELMNEGHIDLKPRYRPWIGAGLSEHISLIEQNPVAEWGATPRTHVMGESHYSDDYPDDEHLTRTVISDWAFEKYRGGRFFTKVLQIIQACDADQVDRRSGWGGIAYSNFVQELLPACRRAPSTAQWEDARRRFFGQLAITRPNILLVLGKRLWQQLPWTVGVSIPTIPLDDRSPAYDAWLYPYWVDGNLRFTVALNVIHPSGRGFSWREAARCYGAIVGSHRLLVRAHSGTRSAKG